MLKKLLGIAALAVIVVMTPLTADAKGGKGGGKGGGGVHHGSMHHHRHGGVFIGGVAPLVVVGPRRGCGPYKHWSHRWRRCVWD